jgi:iron-sulfur cluster assembly accessory protein
MLSLTEIAQKKVIQYLSELSEADDKFLRIYVAAGGCSGFQYGLSFDKKNEEDQVVEYDKFQIVVDPQSVTYLTGAVVDYIETLGQEGFSISNPSASSTCGCGKSFSA